MEKTKSVYLVLAGGFWNLSKKQDLAGYQVDANDKAKASVDYIIKMNNLPEEFIKHSETKRKYTYFCEQCKRYVTETEWEEKRGCVARKGHDITEDFTDINLYQPGIFDQYSIPRMKWLKPCFRIFMNHSKGIDKWRDIWRYVVQTTPPTTRLVPDLLPVAVGDRMQWLVQPDDVPVIQLPGEDENEIVMPPRSKTPTNRRTKGE